MNYFKKFEEKPNNFFQYIYWNLFFGYLPFGVLISILSLFGKIAFTLNNEPVYGIVGFLMYAICIPILTLIFTLVIWIYMSIGNFILRLVSSRS